MTRLAALALCAALLAPAAGAAPMICGPRPVMVAEIEGRYGETRRSIGLTGGGAVVEIYASDETGGWTILLTGTNGRSCVLTDGDAYQADPPPKPGEAL